mgnify:CR=1 FL=1
MTIITQNYELQNRDNYSIITFAGELDAHIVETLGPAMQAQLDDTCRHLVVDLGQVGFIDSHGVGLFVKLLKRVHRRHGQFIIAGAEGQPAAVLRMVGLNKDLVTYCIDKESAIALLATAD